MKPSRRYYQILLAQGVFGRDEPEAFRQTMLEVFDAQYDSQEGVDRCTGCGSANCSFLWSGHSKCCPDCSHQPGAATVAVASEPPPITDSPVTRQNMDGGCLGRPVGFTGGPVAWCGVPVRQGCRFCARCYAIRLADIESDIRTNVILLHRSRQALSALQLEGPGT